MALIPGLITGLKVTARTMFRTLFGDGLPVAPAPSKHSHTVQYPPRQGDAHRPGPRGDRPPRGELHCLHALRP